MHMQRLPGLHLRIEPAHYDVRGTMSQSDGTLGGVLPRRVVGSVGAEILEKTTD